MDIDVYDIDLTNSSHLKEIIQEIEGAQNIKRKKDAFTAFECQEGRQKEHVTAKLETLYPSTFNKFRVGNVEIVKKAIKKKSKSYKSSPIRKLNTDNETEELATLYSNNKFSRAFKEADRVFNLHKYVCMWLSYTNPPEDSDELNGTYNLQALAPYEYDLIRDDKGNPVIFILSYSGTDVTKGMDGIEQTITEDQRDTAAQTKRYSFWNATTFTKAATRIMSDGTAYVDAVSTKPNQIGRLPIAFLSQDTAVDYPVPSSLADKAIDWNVEFSDLKTASATQGHGQLILKHPEGMKLKQVHMGMHTAINLPQSKKDADKPTEANYISASPDLLGQLSVLKFSLLQILDDEGITAKTSIDGGLDNVTSGFDRLLKEADVQDSIEDNQSLYSENLEQDVYLTVKSFEDALNTNIFKSDEVAITFEKPKVLITDKETLDNIEKREQLGLLLPYEKHMIVNPNLTEKEATAREASISKLKKENALAVTSVLGDGEAIENE